MERELDRRIGAASAVMKFVYQTVVVTLAFSLKSKLSIRWSVYTPTLSYGHESLANWIEKTRLWMQAALHGVAGRSLRDRRISRKADSPFDGQLAGCPIWQTLIITRLFCSSNKKDRDPFKQGHDRVKEHFLIFSFIYLLWNYFFFQIYLGRRVMGVNKYKMDQWVLMARKLKERIYSSHLSAASVSGQPGGCGWEEGLIWVFFISNVFLLIPPHPITT